MESAAVILLLVSPDFIASDYCYEREMTRALERHERGDAKVIPVILRPCDWHDLPFGKLLATPRDGLPITKRPNIDDAFLDMVTAIKHALRDRGESAKRVRAIISESSKLPSPSTEQVRSSNLRIKKQFTDLDEDQFRHDGFELHRKVFREFGRRVGSAKSRFAAELSQT